MNRIYWIDACKGLAILLVVLGHVISNGISSGNVISEQFFVLHNYIFLYAFILFFTSGYLLKI